MLRNIQYRRLKLLRQTISPRQLSTTLAFLKGDDSSDSNSSSIENLFKKMEEPEKEPSSKLQDLVKILKDRDVQKKGVMTTRMKDLDKIRHKKGKEFWFKQDTSLEKSKMEEVEEKQTTEEALSNVLIEGDKDGKESVIDDSVLEELPVQVPAQVEALEVGQLKQDIVNRADNRSVSKLMSALIDDIDQESHAPEETLKSLMAAMNKKVSENVDLSEEMHDPRARLQERQFGRRAFNLTVGPSTNLFSDFVFKPMEGQSAGSMNLHEKKWQTDLNASLPQNVPQNSFEEMMLNIDQQWKFPIDNEQDLGVEDETSFEEHVFLDYLFDEFPETGPVRKFMELVITGLQQNPFLSVEEKESRALWFKNYFENFPEEELSM